MPGVFERETTINLAEREIDEMALDLLAMQQPMAIDLRFIVAVIKINADIERVGDQAVNIAQRTLDLMQERDIDIPVDVPHGVNWFDHDPARAGGVSPPRRMSPKPCSRWTTSLTA